jgi:hypothetical protein
MQPPPKIQRIIYEGTSVLEVERDPGLRCQIWEYPPDEQDLSCESIHEARSLSISHGCISFFRFKETPM